MVKQKSDFTGKKREWPHYDLCHNSYWNHLKSLQFGTRLSDFTSYLQPFKVAELFDKVFLNFGKHHELSEHFLCWFIKWGRKIFSSQEEMQKWCKTGMNGQGGRLGSFIRWLEEYSWSSVSYVDLCSRQRRENKEISFVLVLLKYRKAFKEGN